MNTKSKARRTPYTQCEGKLYVRAKYAGMHILSLLVDGTPIVLLGRSKTMHLHIDDAIQWHENEIAATLGAWDRKTLDALLEARRKFQASQPEIKPV